MTEMVLSQKTIPDEGEVDYEKDVQKININEKKNKAADRMN